MTIENPLAFECNGSWLIGALHRPVAPPTAGVVVVVGGPQYRAGSHRQFVLLARRLAAAGIAVLRFDCRGMGDSEGEFPGFENIADDIRAALDALLRAVPSVTRAMLWGLCDAASAIAFYAQEDARVDGAILLNPWVRTETSQARAYVKHYYWQRLRERAFWRKLLRGEFAPAKAIHSFAGNLRQTLGKSDRSAAEAALPERMASAIDAYGGPVLLVISGRDLTAREFDDAAGASVLWQRIFSSRRFQRRELAEADHTFSRRDWCDQVAAWTSGWVKSEAHTK